MEQRLDLLTLGVTDLDRARRFYVNGLGWTPALDLDEVIFFQIGHGILLGLFGHADLERDMHGHAVSAEPAPPSRLSLSHNVASEDAVDQAFERAVAAGASIIKVPTRAAFGGYHGYIADPDGFVWEIAHNPGLTIDADGTVHIVPIAPD